MRLALGVVALLAPMLQYGAVRGLVSPLFHASAAFAMFLGLEFLVAGLQRRLERWLLVLAAGSFMAAGVGVFLFVMGLGVMYVFQGPSMSHYGGFDRMGEGVTGVMIFLPVLLSGFSLWLDRSSETPRGAIEALLESWVPWAALGLAASAMVA